MRQVKRRINATFVSPNNDEVVAFKFSVTADRRRVSTQLDAGKASGGGIQKFTGRPYDMFGPDGFLFGIHKKNITDFCHPKHGGVGLDRQFTKRCNGVQVKSVFLPCGVFDFETECR